MAFLKDDTFKYIMINEKNAGFFGKKPEEIIGKDDFFLMPPDAAAACRQSDENALRENTIVISEETVGGRVYETRKFPVALKNGRTGIGGYIRDFTDLKTARENLIRSEDMLKKAQKVAHVGSWTWNIKTNSLEWSDEMFRIFDIDKDTFTGDLGDVIARSIHPEDRPAVEESNLAVAQDKRPVPLEYRIVLPDGNVRSVYAEAGELTLDENGNSAVLTGIAQDITERKKAEEELKFRNLLLTTQQETSIDGILSIDKDWKIISYNKRFLDMWGISSGEMETKSGTHILHLVLQVIKDTDQYEKKVKYLSEHFDETSFDEINFPDGRCFEGYSAPMIGYDGKYYGRIWYFHDITNRKKSDDELKKYKDHLEELVKVRTNELARGRNMLRTLIDSLPDEIYAKDSESRFIMANYPILHTFGLSVFEDILGKTDFDLMPKEEAMKAYEKEHSVLQT